ncbi:uncharacterized protein PG998_012749 [Apiospora kogelbergensis]|uniref:uncharacterized protein n=1 Tax=Apiospora kogelbergensis TaxID=1337665 RepID=UPI00312F1ADC
MQFSLAIAIQAVVFVSSIAALPLEGGTNPERRTVEVDVQQNTYNPNQKRTVEVDVQQNTYYPNQKRN